MHKCLKCGRPVANVDEITEGCPCGSKVFVFHRLPSAGEETVPVSSQSVSITNAPSPAPAAIKPSDDDGISPIDMAGESASHSQTSASSPIPPRPSEDMTHPAPSPQAPVASGDADMARAISDSSDFGSQITSTFPPLGVLGPNPTPALVASSLVFSDSEEETDPDDPTYSEVWMTKGGRIESMPGGSAQITSALDASASPSASLSAEVANVRQLKRGVYEIDVGRLGGEPLVVQDSAGIYYVRLPFTPLGEKSPGESVGTPKPKNKIE